MHVPFPVDTTKFQCRVPEDDAEEAALLEPLAAEARGIIESIPSSPPIYEILLAYGVGGVLALFLIRFAYPITGGESDGEMEVWTVVGDLPSVVFETESARTPSDALRLYCAICQDWADTVLAGGDRSECYPIRAEPTREHAEMLLGRIEFIREKLIPLA
jgi:hypothetical protein